MAQSRVDLVLFPDPDERVSADARLRVSPGYGALASEQRAAVDRALTDGFLAGSVDDPCSYGAAPGARRLLQHASEWYECSALWVRHCRRTARPCIEVTIFPDGLAQVQMRHGSAAWLKGADDRRRDIERRLSSVVVTHSYRPWRLSELWVTRALATDDAIALAREVVALDVNLRIDRVVEYVTEC